MTRLAATVAIIMLAVQATNAKGVVPSRAHIVNVRYVALDAQGRAQDAERARHNYRGLLGPIQITPATITTASQLRTLGFRRIFESRETYLLVQTRTSDAQGTWLNYYVYDLRTHLLKYELERLQEPSAKKANRRLGQ